MPLTAPLIAFPVAYAANLPALLSECIVLSVSAYCGVLIPNISKNNFCAGIKQASATIAYIGCSTASCIVDPITTEYKSRCIGCINKFTIYSLSHTAKALPPGAFFFLKGYVTAVRGAIIVKNAI